MKHIITILLILFIVNSQYSQQKPIVGELIIKMEDRPFPNPWEVEVELKALGTVWNCGYDIDDAGDYSGGTKIINQQSSGWL